MKQSLSAMLDGEQSAHEMDSICAAGKRSDVRSDFSDYLLIGAVLRRETQLSFDVAAKVMAALDDEPTVFAPHPATVTKVITPASPRRHWDRKFSALAAGLAGVLSVAWVALSLSRNEPAAQLAALTSAEPVATQIVEVPQRAIPETLQDYVVAHQTHSSSVALTGGMRNVRAVSAGQEGR